MMLNFPRVGKTTPVTNDKMTGPVAVLCPTRRRPESALRMVNSFLETTTKASLFLLFDDINDVNKYTEEGVLFEHPRYFWAISQHTGGPINMVSGALHNIHAPFDIYGMVPDDCEFKTKGWDDFLIKKFAEFPNRIGVISAWHNYGRVVNFPWVTRQWCEAVGWYWYPNNFHHCCDTILEVLGECSNSIYYANPDEFDIMHYHEPSFNREAMDHDMRKMFDFIVSERREYVQKIKVAQGLVPPEKEYRPWEAVLPGDKE